MRILIIILFIVSSISGMEPSQTISIAVNELKGNELTAGDLETLSNRLRSELIKTGSFKVMERAEMNAILMEQEFQQTGACDESSCIIEMGKFLGVQEIIAGSVGKFGADFYTISLRMIDVATGEIKKSADYDYNGELSGLLTDGLVQAAAILAGKSFSEASKLLSTKPQRVTIGSTPSNAVVTVDTLKGVTTFNATLLPGIYPVSITLDGYEPMHTQITVTEAVPFGELYTLKPLLNPNAKLVRRGRVTRIVSAIIGTAFVGTAVLFNNKASESTTNALELKKNGEQLLKGSAELNELNAKYSQEVSKRDEMKLYRTISYGLAGASFTLFTVSFAFGKELK